jgi:hypothetical protein
LRKILTFAKENSSWRGDRWDDVCMGFQDGREDYR